MNKTITLEFPEKKLEALSHFPSKPSWTTPWPGCTKRPYRPPSGNSWRTQDRTAIHLRISKITYKDVQRYGRGKPTCQPTFRKPSRTTWRASATK